MSIIAKVGRDSAKVRLLNLAIHLVLLLGALTMVYPFLLMLSSSLKSNVDSTRLSLIPQYLHDDAALFRKYLESRYNEESSRLGDNHPGKWLSFAEVTLPELPSEAVYRDWREFIAAQPQGVYDYYVAEHYGRGVYPLNQRRYRKLLRRENGNDLQAFNRRYNTGAQSWEQIVVEEKEILSRNYVSESEGYLGRFQAFKKAVEERHRNYVNLDGAFAQTELAAAWGGDLNALRDSTGLRVNCWDDIHLAESCPPEGDPLREPWLHFVRKTLNIHHIELRDAAAPAFQAMLRAKYGEIGLLNRTWHTGYASFAEVRIPRQLPDSGARVEDLTWFVENLAAAGDLQVRSIGAEFRAWLKAKYGDTAALLEAWKPGYASFEAVGLPAFYPGDNLAQSAAWLEFARGEGLRQLELLPAAQQDWHKYLAGRYPSGEGSFDLRVANQAFRTNAANSDELYPPPRLPSQEPAAGIWKDFVARHANPLQLRLTGAAASGWKAFLRREYGSVERLNQSWGYLPASFEAVNLPLHQIEHQIFIANRGVIRREFITRNYAMVLDQMFNDARSLRNTAIYALLSILLAVTVNPLAAYALSRFKPKFSYQVIMLFMLTMAFPAMVMGIPNFLILKKLNLLNTFWALVLPAAADGYFIFLLKGFFDSLPRELYESASLDGAGEFRLFWQFTLYLSKPILAVIALGAFNAAYRNFLFAFIVCQDQSMWTLMVHIYELMQRASLSVGYAALVIAAVPTLAVFIFFQNIIIKGIVVPMEK